jgi:thioredoxin 1
MNMATKKLDEGNFEESVKSGIALVDFWAPWCGPCQAFAPTYEKVSNANPDLVFGKVNTQEQPDLAAAFGIQAIPTLMAYRDGIMVHKQSGAMPAHAVQQLVDQIKSLDMIKVRADVERQAASILMN